MAVLMTPKQERFVAEYLIDLNATQAAIRAGYSKRTASSQGDRLLRNAEIQLSVQQRNLRRMQKIELKAERVLEELARLAFFDIRKAFNADGSLKRMEDLDEDTARALASVEVVTVEKGEGQVEHVAKIRASDKGRAIDLAMRHFGLLNDKLEVNTGNWGDRLARAKAARAERQADRTKEEGEA